MLDGSYFLRKLKVSWIGAKYTFTSKHQQRQIRMSIQYLIIYILKRHLLRLLNQSSCHISRNQYILVFHRVPINNQQHFHQEQMKIGIKKKMKNVAEFILINHGLILYFLSRPKLIIFLPLKKLTRQKVEKRAMGGDTAINRQALLVLNEGWCLQAKQMETNRANYPTNAFYQ